ncbi:(4Fe-4S)-binding protein, partial [bacterium]
AQKNNLDWVIVDGAPGIGCQVIASLTGVDGAIVVSEPTLSAIHDLKRVVELADHFHLKIGVVVNKSDINPSLAREIKRWADENKLPTLAEIPLDRRIVDAMAQRKSPIEIGDDSLSEIYKNIWEKFVEEYFTNSD